MIEKYYAAHIKTSRDAAAIGTVLYLESSNNTDTARIGLETGWGGSIVEVSVNGTEYVNRDGSGREIQLSFRDGNRPYWNPTMGGDEDNQGTPTLAWTVNPESIYTKSQPLEWYVEENGGGVGRPIMEDMQVEQTIFAVTSQPHTFKAHYKVTHLGSDLHADAPTEYPAVYTNRDYNQFVYYGGSAPWTDSAVTNTTLPNFPSSVPAFTLPSTGALWLTSRTVDSWCMCLRRIHMLRVSRHPTAVAAALPTITPTTSL